MSSEHDPIRAEGDPFAPVEAPSRWRTVLDPKVLIAFFSSLIVFSMAIVDVGRSSPGPLSEPHARESQLAGRFGCADCHGGWRQSMARACMECHEDVEHQVDASTGFHGELDGELALECGRCHSDHHGAGVPLVQEHSFRLAGFDGRADFDHDFIGFGMGGKHLELECSECHTQADVAHIGAGEQRFGGLSKNCATCHEDAHTPSLGTRCDRCHVQESFEHLISEGHERHLALIGGHGGLDCRECHGDSERWSLEAHAAEDLPARNCKSCHASPHAERFELGIAALEGTARGRACAECHMAEHTRFDDPGVPMSDAHHAASGFPLEEPHAEQDCAECHAASGASFEERYPGRAADHCAECHADPHGGQFLADYGLEGAGDLSDCRRCHAATHFAPHTFDQVAHAETRLALEGAHADTECAACHSMPEEGLPAAGVRSFMGTELTCEGCHGDPHRGLLDHGAVSRAGGRGVHGSCAACHASTRFDDVDLAEFRHGHFAGFDLLGAHEQADCQACHPATSEADELGRRLGFAGGSFERVAGCVDCHADPHGGAFERAGLPLEVGDSAGCARCHTESSFRLMRAPFDHGAWTGFELEGHHAEASCTACHPSVDPGTNLGKSLGFAAGSSCVDCHAAPHRDQFLGAPPEPEGLAAKACASCHTDSVAWHARGFDHEAHSRFVPGASHSDVACDACHAKEADDQGRFVRYRPLERECRDCHGFESGSLRAGERALRDR